MEAKMRERAVTNIRRLEKMEDSQLWSNSTDPEKMEHFKNRLTLTLGRLSLALPVEKLLDGVSPFSRVHVLMSDSTLLYSSTNYSLVETVRYFLRGGFIILTTIMGYTVKDYDSLVKFYGNTRIRTITLAGLKTLVSDLPKVTYYPNFMVLEDHYSEFADLLSSALTAIRPNYWNWVMKEVPYMSRASGSDVRYLSTLLAEYCNNHLIDTNLCRVKDK